MQKGLVVKTIELEHDTLLLKTQERRSHFKENMARGWYRVLGKKLCREWILPLSSEIGHIV